MRSAKKYASYLEDIEQWQRDNIDNAPMPTYERWLEQQIDDLLEQWTNEANLRRQISSELDKCKKRNHS